MWTWTTAGGRIGGGVMSVRLPDVLGHTGIPGLAPFVAIALFFAGAGAGFGAYRLLSAPSDLLHRATGIGLGVVAFGCLGLATVFPLIIHATPTFARPSTTARLEVLSPREGELFRGHPATIPVRVRLEGGRIVAFSSLHLVRNGGHIHLYLDGSLVSMTGLEAQIAASPGTHTLRAEFVAVDHGPFRPRVQVTVTFRVEA